MYSLIIKKIGDLREVAKKVPTLVFPPLRRGGGDEGQTKPWLVWSKVRIT